MEKIFLAMLLLGTVLMAGNLTDGLKAYKLGNKMKAKELWEKACDLGNRDGCAALGLLYDKGDGLKQDKRKAKKLYGKACDLGHSTGCKYYKTLKEQGY